MRTFGFLLNGLHEDSGSAQRVPVKVPYQQLFKCLQEKRYDLAPGKIDQPAATRPLELPRAVRVKDQESFKRPLAHPNFFIIGAAKSGTSSLWHYLRQHPDVGMPHIKEPNYFVSPDTPLRDEHGPPSLLPQVKSLHKYSVTDTERYLALFSGFENHRVRGEASVRYLYAPQVPLHIHNMVPEARFIVLLRNPVDRLLSHYGMMRNEYFREPLNLRNAIDAEPERIRENWGWDWHYVRTGLYAQQLDRYLKIFSRDRFLILLHDEFVSGPRETMKTVFRFLDVEEAFSPDMNTNMRSGYWPRSEHLHRFVHTSRSMNQLFRRVLRRNNYLRFRNLLVRINRTSVPRLSTSVRQDLMRRFHKDIARLSEILERPLPWL